MKHGDVFRVTGDEQLYFADTVTPDGSVIAHALDSNKDSSKHPISFQLNSVAEVIFNVFDSGGELVVHVDPATHSGKIFLYPNVEVFSESWFDWLEKEAPTKIAINIMDERDDDKLCSVQKIDNLWYVIYKGYSRNYLVSIGSTSELNFDNLWSTLRLVQQFVHREEGSLRRQ